MEMRILACPVFILESVLGKEYCSYLSSVKVR